MTSYLKQNSGFNILKHNLRQIRMLLQFIAEFTPQAFLHPGAFTNDIIPAIAAGSSSHDRKHHHRTAEAKKITHKGKQSIRKKGRQQPWKRYQSLFLF